MESRGKVKVFRSAEEWQELISRQEQSGKTVVEFCRETGIVRTSFEKWRRKLRERDGGGRFQELPKGILSEVSEVCPARSGSCEVELELGAGLRLVIRR